MAIERRDQRQRLAENIEQQPTPPVETATAGTTTAAAGGVEQQSPLRPPAEGAAVGTTTAATGGIEQQALPTSPAERDIADTGRRSTFECHICKGVMENDENDPLRTIAHCMHTFHLECITKWAEHRNKPVDECCPFKCSVNVDALRAFEAEAFDAEGITLVGPPVTAASDMQDENALLVALAAEAVLRADTVTSANPTASTDVL